MATPICPVCTTKFPPTILTIVTGNVVVQSVKHTLGRNAITVCYTCCAVLVYANGWRSLEEEEFDGLGAKEKVLVLKSVRASWLLALSNLVDAKGHDIPHRLVH